MAASNLSDFPAVVRQMREMDVSVVMFGTSGAVEEFRDALGEDAEFAYGLSAWEPSVDTPGVERFTADYRAAFDREPSFHAAGAYGSCRLFAEAAERAGSLDQDAIRDALLTLETTTVFGPFAVDERGYQTAHRGLFIQWQDGRNPVITRQSPSQRKGSSASSACRWPSATSARTPTSGSSRCRRTRCTAAGGSALR
jgi:branched-chain amino acid transport system substrate-binding protein